MTDYICALFYRIKAELSKKTGQGMVEYALVLAAVAIIAAFVLSDDGGLKDKIEGAFSNAGDQIDNASTAVEGKKEG